MRKMLLLALLVLLTVYGAMAQGIANQLTVRGKITDETGAPVSSATVVVKGTSYGTTSDKTGSFSFNCPPNSSVIVVSSLGFLDKETPIVRDGQTFVRLTPDQKDMDQIVVVAYGAQKKISLTGSVSTANAFNLEKRPLTNPLGVLEGTMPGVQVNNTVGQPGSAPEIRTLLSMAFPSPVILQISILPILKAFQY
jgi:TonB-dependent starch-binding outer membrane protein SusC